MSTVLRVSCVMGGHADHYWPATHSGNGIEWDTYHDILADGSKCLEEGVAGCPRYPWICSPPLPRCSVLCAWEGDLHG